MSCDCIEKVDAKLAPHNTKLAPTITFGRDGKLGYVSASIVVEKIVPRGKRPVVMLATFCPFCGERYVEAETVSCST